MTVYTGHTRHIQNGIPYAEAYPLYLFSVMEISVKINVQSSLLRSLSSV